MSDKQKKFKGRLNFPVANALSTFALAFSLFLFFALVSTIVTLILMTYNEFSALGTLLVNLDFPKETSFYILSILLCFLLIILISLGFFIYTTFLEPEKFNSITIKDYFKYWIIAIAITVVLILSLITTSEVFSLVVGILSATALAIQFMFVITKISSREK